MGFTERFVRLIFRGRIRMMERIGEAARLIGEGRAEETLEVLARMERRIPPYVGYLYFLTRARALDELGRYEEAEVAYTAAVFAKQGATEAYLHLAILCGRLRRFDDARAWIGRIGEDEAAAPDLVARAGEVLALVEAVEGGARLEQIRQRARAFAERRALEGDSPAEALGRVDEWIAAEPDEAQAERDELACWLGELVVSSGGGSWLLSLALDDSEIEAGGHRLKPFALVARRLEGQGSLAEAFDLNE